MTVAQIILQLCVTCKNQYFSFIQGLPSAYLHQSSVHSSASQTPSHTASHTPSGTPDSSPPLSPPPAPNSQSSLTSRLAGDGGRKTQQREYVQRGGEKGSNSSYNPFDSEGEILVSPTTVIPFSFTPICAYKILILLRYCRNYTSCTYACLSGSAQYSVCDINDKLWPLPLLQMWWEMIRWEMRSLVEGWTLIHSWHN